MIVAKEFLDMPKGTEFWWEGTACAFKDSGHGWEYPLRFPSLCKRLGNEKMDGRTLAFFYDDSIGAVRYITIYDRTADEELYYLHKTQNEAVVAFKADCRFAINNLNRDIEKYTAKCRENIKKAERAIELMDEFMGRSGADADDEG